MNYQKLLKSKKYKIAVWGTGYIGLSTMVYFSKKKIKCVGFDINKEKIKKINSGLLPLADLKKWFGFDIKGLVKSNYLQSLLLTTFIKFFLINSVLFSIYFLKKYKYK